MSLFTPFQNTSEDSFIQMSLLFMNTDLHLMLSLDSTFEDFIHYFLFLFCSVFIIINLQSFNILV